MAGKSIRGMGRAQDNPFPKGKQGVKPGKKKA